MVPIWVYAGKRLSAELKSRQVPLLAMSAAFSFVIMMFNIPIPGGSTGHAVGGAIIGIVLGPWAAVIAITVALVLQAMVFGDGGIYAIAANCFNMAVVMPFVAFYAYNFISNGAAITSSRRVKAAAVAGWASLTVAAAVTGFEFGIQPILNHSAEGIPLYMPYSLGVTSACHDTRACSWIRDPGSSDYCSDLSIHPENRYNFTLRWKLCLARGKKKKKAAST